MTKGDGKRARGKDDGVSDNDGADEEEPLVAEQVAGIVGGIGRENRDPAIETVIGK